MDMLDVRTWLTRYEGTVEHLPMLSPQEMLDQAAILMKQMRHAMTRYRMERGQATRMVDCFYNAMKDAEKIKENYNHLFEQHDAEEKALEDKEEASVASNDSPEK